MMMWNPQLLQHLEHFDNDDTDAVEEADTEVVEDNDDGRQEEAPPSVVQVGDADENSRDNEDTKSGKVTHCQCTAVLLEQQQKQTLEEESYSSASVDDDDDDDDDDITRKKLILLCRRRIRIAITGTTLLLFLLLSLVIVVVAATTTTGTVVVITTTTTTTTAGTTAAMTMRMMHQMIEMGDDDPPLVVSVPLAAVVVLLLLMSLSSFALGLCTSKLVTGLMGRDHKWDENPSSSNNTEPRVEQQEQQRSSSSGRRRMVVVGHEEQQPSDDNNHADDEAEQQQQRQRLFYSEISKLLGTIGAPLPLLLSVLSTTTRKTAPPDREEDDNDNEIEMMQSAIQFVKIHVELIFVIQHAMNILRHGTCLLFSKSARTKNNIPGIERLERTVLSRWKKLQHKKLLHQRHIKNDSTSKNNDIDFVQQHPCCYDTSEQQQQQRQQQQQQQQRRIPGVASSGTGVVVALPLLRRRVYEILDGQLQLLQLVLSSSSSMSLEQQKQEESNNKEQERSNYTIPPSLSLLRIFKADVTNAVSDVLDQWMQITGSNTCAGGGQQQYDDDTDTSTASGGNNVVERMRTRMEDSMQFAHQSADYLRAACIPHHQRQHFGTRSPDVCNDVWEQVDALHVALMAYQEECEAEDVTASDSTVAVAWWERIAKISRQLDVKVQETHTRLLASTSKSTSLLAEARTEDSSSLDNNNMGEPETAELFAADDHTTTVEGFSPHQRQDMSSVVHDQHDDGSKTLVFSGVAAPPATRRCILMASQSSSSLAHTVHADPCLLEELHLRLQSLPPVVECKVNHHQEDKCGKYGDRIDQETKQESQQSQKQYPSDLANECIQPGSLSSAATEDFLGELGQAVKAVAATATLDDAVEFEYSSK